MAAGKSTVGRYLARELGVAFVDSDAVIIARHGPIETIFARDGEAAFRALEFETVRGALEGPIAVLALGGGAVTHEPTRALLAERAFVIYLQVSAAALVGRLRRSKTVRPLAGEQPSFAGVRALLAAREPYYRRADLTASGPHTSRAKYARELAAALRARGIASPQ